MISISLDKIDLHKLPHYIIFFLFFSAFILPGYGYLHLVNKNLLYSLENLQIILTSFLYSLPIFLLWTFEEIISEKSKENNEPLELILKAALKTNLWFYGFVLFSKVLIHFGPNTLLADLWNGLAFFYGFHVLMAFLDIIDAKFIYKKKDKQKTTNNSI